MRAIIWISIFLISVSLLSLLVTGQNQSIKPKESSGIEQLQKAIDQTNQLLSGSHQEKEQLLKKLDLLQSQIGYRKELQSKLKSELQQTDSATLKLRYEYEHSADIHKSLLKAYRNSLKNKLIHRLTYNPLLAVLSPENIDGNVKRWYILERKERDQMQTLTNLRLARTTFHQTLGNLESESKKQDSLLRIFKNEEQELTKDIDKSKSLISNLNTRESGLNAELIAYKQRKVELNKLIESRIKNFTEKADSKKLKSPVKVSLPLKNATIISRFGTNMDDGSSKLLIRNNGIDLQSSNPFVQVSTDAEVVEIRKMPNQKYLLITRANNLFVVYSNLENVLLKNGEQIIKGVNLGKAGRNDDGFYELHFETWMEKKAIDPMQFLK
jgi:septal ring factor EnvC (AmiA/AmiB activator)